LIYHNTIRILKKMDKCGASNTYTKEVIEKFIYENIITRFGYTLTTISDLGNHFVNGTIQILMEEFFIDHRKISSYHPHENGETDSFNKTLNKCLTKICKVDIDDWDDKVPIVKHIEILTKGLLSKHLLNWSMDRKL